MLHFIFVLFAPPNLPPSCPGRRSIQKPDSETGAQIRKPGFGNWTQPGFGNWGRLIQKLVAPDSETRIRKLDPRFESQDSETGHKIRNEGPSFGMLDSETRIQKLSPIFGNQDSEVWIQKLGPNFGN